MAAQTNLNGLARGAYTAAGAALIAWGFLGTDTEWMHYLLPTLGGIILVEGIIGYCAICAAFGLGKKG